MDRNNNNSLKCRSLAIFLIMVDLVLLGGDFAKMDDEDSEDGRTDKKLIE